MRSYIFETVYVLGLNEFPPKVALSKGPYGLYWMEVGGILKGRWEVLPLPFQMNVLTIVANSTWGFGSNCKKGAKSVTVTTC